MAKRNINPEAYIVSVVIDLLVEENFREYLNSIPSFPIRESTRKVKLFFVNQTKLKVLFENLHISGCFKTT
ncbi:hypothetical protein ACOSQ4_004070 [Xanthoceras sorbifolium]